MGIPKVKLDEFDRFDDQNIRTQIEDYDRDRNAHRPIAAQRDEPRFGRSETYGWSEDKARQYASPERQNFGAFIRNKGFDLS